MTKLLTEKDVAVALRMSLSAIRNWRSKKIGPPTINLGKSVRYPEDAFEKWLEDKVNGTPE
jgi:predicted DNA-binding transcriptional regulator AlpA